jgi:hypothetical protein
MDNNKLLNKKRKRTAPESKEQNGQVKKLDNKIRANRPSQRINKIEGLFQEAKRLYEEQVIDI